MSQISREMVNEVLQALRIGTDNDWESVDWELQDGAEFLLVKVSLAKRPLDRNAPHRMLAYAALSRLIPPKTNGDYSWMVVFTHADEVCDSVMTGVI